MERKDYVLIATAIRNVRNENPSDGDALVGLNLVALRLARALAEENGRFDRARFLTACGFKLIEYQQ